MRLAWTVTAGIALILLLAGFYLWLYVLRDTTTRSQVTDAVSQFRAERGRHSIAPGLRGKVPEPGVYRYRTRGGESFDSVVETDHDFDGVSTITLSATRCGVREHWRVLRERWSETELCLGPDGAQLRLLTEFHQFFGQGRLTEYSCREEPVPYTRDLRPGTEWTSRCRSADGEITSQVRVDGIEPVTVAGTAYPAVRIETETELEGDPDGSAERTAWLRRSDGLILKRTATSSAQVDAAGGGDFSEDYTLELISIQASN